MTTWSSIVVKFIFSLKEAFNSSKNILEQIDFGVVIDRQGEFGSAFFVVMFMSAYIYSQKLLL